LHPIVAKGELHWQPRRQKKIESKSKWEEDGKLKEIRTYLTKAKK
jgi:hypothetical protein